MKQIISAVAFAGLFTMAGCSNSAIKEKDTAIRTQQHTIDSMNAELAKNRVIDSMNEVNKMQYSMQSTMPVVVEQPVITTTTQTTSRSYATHHRNRGHHQSNPISQSTVYQQPAAAPHKKGWSAKAKGAVIGTATGAAVGALVNGRNRAAGAVIGGILGAGTGTGVGAVIDKKKGR